MTLWIETYCKSMWILPINAKIMQETMERKDKSLMGYEQS